MTSEIIVTVDAVLFTVVDGVLNLVLVERAAEPCAGRLALIGGFVHEDEDESLEAAVHRIIRDKAGLSGIFIEQLRSFGGPRRDPRGWSVSVAYYALVPQDKLSDAEGASIHLVPVDRRSELPFDHERILAAARSRLGNKSSYSSLPTFLLPSEFSFPDLKAVYEVVMGAKLDDSAFRRKIGNMKIIEEIPEGFKEPTAKCKRPAKLYRRTGTALVEFDSTV